MPTLLEDYARVTIDDAQKMSDSRLLHFLSVTNDYATRADDYVPETIQVKLKQAWEVLDSEVKRRNLEE